MNYFDSKDKNMQFYLKFNKKLSKKLSLITVQYGNISNDGDLFHTLNTFTCIEHTAILEHFNIKE